jgi:hypothetical protein
MEDLKANTYLTSKLNIMKKIFLLCIIVSIFASCTNIYDDVKKNQEAYYEVAIEGSLNLQLKMQGSCTHVSANYTDVSSIGIPNLKSLTITAGDDQNRIIGIVLYFNSLPVDGIFHLGMDENPLIYRGNANYNTDALNGLSMYYSTDEDNLGTCTITEFNQASQTISGNFNFTGQG